MITAYTKPPFVRCTDTNRAVMKAGLERSLADIASTVTSGSSTKRRALLHGFPQPRRIWA